MIESLLLCLFMKRHPTEINVPTYIAPLHAEPGNRGFGWRIHPIYGYAMPHDGQDYGAPYGASVWSVANGTVTFVGWNGGYGRMVQVKHDTGMSTRYAHLSATHVTHGQRIVQGQLLGDVGSTGLSTGPHLHLEFRLPTGQPVDPMVYLAAVASPLLKYCALPYRPIGIR